MWFCISLILLVLAVSISHADSWEPFAEIAHPGEWDQIRPGSSLMFSGTDPGGANVDSGNFIWTEPEGVSFEEADWVLAEMNGPGVITRIWVTGKDKNNQGPKIFGRIQIYIDSKDKPAIDLPIEDFFGHAMPFLPPLATPTSGGWINYVPIPFSSYCKVVVTDHKDRFAHRVNGLKQTIPHLYHHINWRKLPEGIKVEPFSMTLSEERKKLLSDAVKELESKPLQTDMKSATYAPKEKREVFSQDGAGRIKVIAFSSRDADKLRLTIYWDGADKPAVDVPARDFFAAGLEPQKFNSLPFSFDGTTYTCRFPMPFDKGAKIYLENRSDEAITAAFGVTCKTNLSPSPSPDKEWGQGVRLRFYAHYIDQELPAGSPDLVVLDTKQGPGQFVGCALTLPHKFMEGNESFIVDGDGSGWVGTGTEDYFNGGWYFCFGTYDHAFSGCTYKDEYVSAYRFHLLDAVSYTKSLVMKLEHGAANEESGRARGAVYWYQQD